MQGNTYKLADESYESFLKDLQNEFGWRFFRLTTFSDLIYANLSRYFITKQKSDRIKTINICIKSLIASELGETDLIEDTPLELKLTVQKETSTIQGLYKRFLNEAMKRNTSNSTLIDEKSYLKILAQIDSKDFPEEHILSILSSLLKS